MDTWQPKCIRLYHCVATLTDLFVQLEVIVLKELLSQYFVHLELIAHLEVLERHLVL